MNNIIGKIYYNNTLLHTIHIPLDLSVEELRTKIITMFTGPPPDNFMFDLEFINHRVAREQYSNYSQVVLPKPPSVYIMAHKTGFTIQKIIEQLNSYNVNPEYLSQYSYVPLDYLHINICASSRICIII